MSTPPIQDGQHRRCVPSSSLRKSAPVAAPCRRSRGADAWQGQSRVLVPVRSEAATEKALLEQLASHDRTPAELLEEIVRPVKDDMEQMNRNLRNVVGNRHPMLMAAADQIFGAGGKKLRPTIVFLVARATAELAGMSDLTAA